MQDYKRQRETNRKNSIVTGILVTLGLHALGLLFVIKSGLTYIYPPPEELGIEIAFEQEPEQERISVTAGNNPQSPQPDRTKDIRLAKASEAPLEGTKANETEEAVNDDFGDVETPDPRPEEKKKEIDKRALFPSADNKAKKDSLAAQTAAKVSDALSAGHSMGNTKSDGNEEHPNVHVKGRHVMGNLPAPEYDVQEKGYVVVKIQIDQYGKVIKAEIGDCSLTNAKIWEAAKKAAMSTTFNVSSTAPAVQEGTIRYVFNLK